MNPIAFVLAVAAALPGARMDGILKGHLDIGPLTPVVRKGHEVHPTPEMYRHYMISISAYPNTTGPIRPHFLRLVKNMHVDRHGNFRIKLHPGQYRVEVVKDTPQLVGSLPSKSVEIESGKTAHLDLNVDTGIR